MKTVSIIAALLAGFVLCADAPAGGDDTRQDKQPGQAPRQGEAEIPTYQVLNCEKDCRSTTPARVIDAPLPSYPLRYEGHGGYYVEALVDVDYTIAADGTVKDAAVESAVGPPEFADNTLRAVSARRYQPAMEGGQPVEENHRVRFVFHAQIRAEGARPSIVSAYQAAVQQSRDNKTPQAIAALRDIVDRTQVNFYERTMAAYALAMLYAQNGDYLTGREMIRIATIGEGQYLEDGTTADAIRLRIRLEALTGEFSEAFAWIGILRQIGADDARESKVADTLRGLIAGPDPLTVEARIPAGGMPVFWQHTLLRRAFEFQAVEGKLDSFELRCRRHGMRSAVSDKSDWTIPASWSGCFINVTGTPGTKFTFVEMPQAAGGTTRPAAP